MRKNKNKACQIAFLQSGGEALELIISGCWQLSVERPSFREIEKRLFSFKKISEIRIDCSNLEKWDSSFVAFVQHFIRHCDEAKIHLLSDNLPSGVKRLLALAAKNKTTERDVSSRSSSLLTRVGLSAIRGKDALVAWLGFSGEVLIALLRMFTGKARYRFSDILLFFQQAGPEAVPIVTLIGVLVGVILAFVGSIQLRIFGAELLVANLVGVGMTREMGAMMTAVIMAGRTGAAYAAQLGSMQVNEEIDALRTMGIPPVEYLVLPRLIGLVVAMPLLYLFANIVGIAGGFLVGVIGLDIGAQEYLNQTASIIRLNDIMGGLLKSVIFGVLIALAGCLRGIQCGRSSAAVGDAATSAVVAGIIFMVVADAFLTILYDMFGV